MITACLNGDRAPRAHPRLPVTPDAVARAARDVVDVGAFMVHVHPRDAQGRESLDVDDVVATVGAIRALVPDVRVSVTTRDGIATDERDKLAQIRAWPAPEDGGPDCATVNWHEPGAVRLAGVLRTTGIAVEAGIWTPHAATAFVSTNWPWQVERVLVEVIPGHTRGSDGLWASERVLAALGMSPAPVLVHGERAWAWPVLRWAQRSGYDVRIGLEDTLVLPDGREARDNTELVAAALASDGGAPTQWPVPDPL
ncbi:3-keto-5-aminohexanoate cleavage protein [Intrasporangium calvum]|uniref:3-keto-5-aminohexanoate cleavage protein n=1 Tax=Intrasporangium calvum TaxID=53358 RepID=A0ABT5GE04_9MICO|nr:3-keto-5-aminohexanoate cleavage protein [Intrasporangium calvum]MDC5696472.1 3-keto-5-aminohexanoate cleavage protein [Intrasporangium calvum]